MSTLLAGVVEQVAEEGGHGAGHGGHGGGESSGAEIIHHITDTQVWHFFKDVEIHLPEFHLFGLDLSISKHVLMLWISGALVFLLFRGMAKSMQREKSGIARGGFALFEMLILFVRDEIAIKSMGEDLGRKLTPFLLTTFFFILCANLLGLIPFMATATGNVSTTAALAVMVFVLVQVQGVIHNGGMGYIKSFIPSGVPGPLAAIIFPIEILSQFTRHFALCIRLFANMIAGHVVILSLITLIFVLGTILVSPLFVGLALFIYLLEILVAFIQAYIFTMLAAMFVGMAAHPEH
ncbi:MAG: F0F1 ATP synthase subunit A [Candidatus Marinimicrobia bacterium]|nr:F0F1 ATP synthase subunit A [Candidatus Neomarinimicrobiota bacterium]